MSKAFNIQDKVRSCIKDMKPYSSARSEFKGSASVFLDANENPFDDLMEYNRYPDAYQQKLKDALSKVKNILSSQIFLGNGSDEIIDIIIRTYCDPGEDSILTFIPGFGMYKVAASINNVHCYEIPLDDEFHLDIDGLISAVSEDVKVIFLCTPNNPTGNSINEDDLLKICESTDTLVVIDEAYIDFSEHRSMVQHISHVPNLLVLQTFSKALGGAGIRIGMAFANEDILYFMNKIKMPYNISSLNQKEAIKVLKNESVYSQMKSLIQSEKKGMDQRLKTYPFIRKVYPSDANFFLIKVDDAMDLYQYLIKDKVIVRNRSNQFGCKNCLRITIGSKRQNELLYHALDNYAN
jgi:histidinol-phosphate aminotransferase